MSNEYTCDDCKRGREVTNKEAGYGTHYCKYKKEFVECYINCNDWIGYVCDNCEYAREGINKNALEVLKSHEKEFYHDVFALCEFINCDLVFCVKFDKYMKYRLECDSWKEDVNEGRCI